MRKLIAMTVLLAVIAAACGGNGGVDVGDSPLAQAMAADFLSDPESPFGGQDDAECFAGKVVGDIGEDRLGALGVTVDNVGQIEDIDFTDGEIDTVLDAIAECVDLKTAIAEQLSTQFGEEPAQCVADKLDAGLLKDAMRAGITGEDQDPSEEFLQAFLDVAAECNVPLS